MAQLIGSVTPRTWLGARTLALLLTAAAACGGGDDAPDDTQGQCLVEPAAACAPDINTTFTSIYSNLLQKRCGTTGNACHGTDGHMGGLVLADPDSAYKALLGQDGTHARVLPNDPNCSVLMERLESDDVNWRMPYMEAKLPDGLRCAVRMWIQAGAAR